MLSFISLCRSALAGIAAVLHRHVSIQLHEQEHGGQFGGRQSGAGGEGIHTGGVVAEGLPQLLVFGVLVRGGRRKGGAPRLLERVLTRRRGAPPFQRVRRGQPPAQGIGQGMGEGGEGGEDFLGGFNQGGT